MNWLFGRAIKAADEVPRMNLFLLDVDTDSMWLSWPGASGSVRYILQYRLVSSRSEKRKSINEPSSMVNESVDEEQHADRQKYKTFSNKLHVAETKLDRFKDPHQQGFFVRVGPVMKNENGVAYWMTHKEPIRLLSEDDGKRRMEAPTVDLGGKFESLLISWSKPPKEKKKKQYEGPFELQMRECKPGDNWKTIAEEAHDCRVRKLHIPQQKQFQFRVRPAALSDAPFSPPSEPSIHTVGLSAGVQGIFQPMSSLLKGDKPISALDAFGGKEFILFYVSGHWVGSCRQYVIKLHDWYDSFAEPDFRTVEVVYVASNLEDLKTDPGATQQRENMRFKEYYRQMPWLAIDYMDKNGRNSIINWLNVQEIPRLAVVDGRSGKVIESQAIGKPLEVNRWREIVASNVKAAKSRHRKK